jgi:hypothetical protein
MIGSIFAPTGKHFAISMVTIGDRRGGTMDHEWLFWDHQDFMNRIWIGEIDLAVQIE